jgi:hypothetical protein
MRGEDGYREPFQLILSHDFVESTSTVYPYITYNGIKMSICELMIGYTAGESLDIGPYILSSRGPGSSVGIVTGYGLDGPGIQSRWKAIFSAPVHTGPGAHSASCKMGTGSYSGVECGQGVTMTQSRAIPLLYLTAFVACKKGENYYYILSSLL